MHQNRKRKSLGIRHCKSQIARNPTEFDLSDLKPAWRPLWQNARVGLVHGKRVSFGGAVNRLKPTNDDNHDT